MTGRAAGWRRLRFSWLFGALVLMLAGYPYFGDTTTGAALGGLTGLLVLGAGVYALGAHRWSLVIAAALALGAAGADLHSLLTQARGAVWAEAAFTAYYGVVTVLVFIEVVRQRLTSLDAILGAVSVYMLLGVAFGSLYDLVATLDPGAFRLNVPPPAGGDAYLGFRELLFFSFMTLTSVGYGDITPVTDQARSLAILESVAGVLYIAVLVGGFVNAYHRRDGDPGGPPTAGRSP